MIRVSNQVISTGTCRSVSLCLTSLFLAHWFSLNSHFLFTCHFFPPSPLPSLVPSSCSIFPSPLLPSPLSPQPSYPFSSTSASSWMRDWHPKCCSSCTLPSLAPTIKRRRRKERKMLQETGKQERRRRWLKCQQRQQIAARSSPTSS